MNDITQRYLEEHYQVHWKHWLMHAATVVLTFALGLAADIGYLRWERQQPKRVWWTGGATLQTNWSPVATSLPARKSGYDVELGVCEDGTAVWRPKP